MSRADRDSFAEDNLPPAADWPDLDLSHPVYAYPERLNATVELLDRWVEERDWGARRCLLTEAESWSYRDLYEQVNRLAHVLIDEMGLVPGNRVLLRAPNTPMMVCAYLAVIKAGGIAVGTMPLLRAGELAQIVDKAEITLALSDARLVDELATAQGEAQTLRRIASFGTEAADGLDAMMAAKPASFEAYDSAADETCLIAFTSGTTGVPKGTMHFHRDLISICRGSSGLILEPTSDDLFAGTPPLAFTFGLGGLALFPLHVGAATFLIEAPTPQALLEVIERHKVSITFSAPTGYRAMLAEIEGRDLSSLRCAVSAGEHLPKPLFDAFLEKTGIRLMDGIGATEMLHTFIAARQDDIRAGATGKVIPGYRARIVDEDMNEVAVGEVGRLAVKGPTGCRYLADARQKTYVRDGWNLTGDAFRTDAEGYFWYVARADDMIISSGYNIAGPEVESALLGHPAVYECGVVGAPDPRRGQIVKAFVVLEDGHAAGDELATALQDHVKATIAPYKYPRAIHFVDALPKTQTGKLQRFKLRRG